jgi:hypothetical protein
MAKTFAQSGMLKIGQGVLKMRWFGVPYIQRATADRMTVEVALKRYLAEIVPTKRSTSQIADIKRATILAKHLGKY